jgi:NDP-sugar pyrophosphorylase family protein
MMKLSFFRHVAIYLVIGIACYSFGACRQSPVLVPGEDDLVVLNGCVISACNYLAAVKTQHSLEKNFWAKILLVRYENHEAGHAYCVWETDGTVYGYDRNAGAFPIPTYTRDPKAIASILAQELSRHLNDSLAVAKAEFVEPSSPVARF